MLQRVEGNIDWEVERRSSATLRGGAEPDFVALVLAYDEKYLYVYKKTAL